MLEAFVETIGGFLRHILLHSFREKKMPWGVFTIVNLGLLALTACLILLR